jgi:hypothetical protein
MCDNCPGARFVRRTLNMAVMPFDRAWEHMTFLDSPAGRGKTGVNGLWTAHEDWKITEKMRKGR